MPHNTFLENVSSILPQFLYLVCNYVLCYRVCIARNLEIRKNQHRGFILSSYQISSTLLKKIREVRHHFKRVGHLHRFKPLIVVYTVKADDNHRDLQVGDILIIDIQLLTHDGGSRNMSSISHMSDLIATKHISNICG